MKTSIYWMRFITKAMNDFRSFNGILVNYGAEFMFKNRTWRVRLVFEQMPESIMEGEHRRMDAYDEAGIL